MKLKTFILTFLMMSCSIVFGQGTMTGNASNENWLKAQLADSDYGTIILANDIELTTGNIVIPNGRTVTIDLNGHTLSTTDNSTYIINNLGKLTIKDSNESGKGKISAYGGIYNGKTYNPNVRTGFGDVNLNAKLTIESGVIEDISSDKRAVIYNYGMLYITGGKFYGKYSGITNYGMADIKNTYIECLGADNDVAAIVNDFDITFGENVYIAGEYRAVTGTAAYTGTPIFLYAELNGNKYSSLQDAIDNAIDGDVVTLIANGTEDEVLITQKADVDVTIDGNNKTFTGHMTISGNNRHTGAETLTIKDVVFKAVYGKGECIASETNNSYAHNVTVEGCTFKGNDTYSADNTFAIRYPSGGVGYDLTVKNCTADNKMFGLLWVTQVVGELIVDNCTAEGVKEGIVLTNTTKATITNTRIEASIVAIRAGQTGAADGTINEFKFNNNILKSNDIAIQIRGNATDSKLSMEENVVSGVTHISGNTADTKISADANYWDGNEAPVATTPIVVNSYYSDEALTNLIRIPMGNDFTAYTSEDAIWGEVWGNASESFVIKVLDANGNEMGTTSLNNIGGIIDGDVNVTWSLKLDAASNADNYWTMEWTTAPSINKMPAKVELYVDGTRVGGGDVVLNAPDNLSKINAANIDADGKILAYRQKLADAVNNGDNVAILTAGTYDVPTGKNLTITGAVDGVVFDNIGAKNMGGANVTFNKVTFDYYPNVDYTGLQHSGNLVYNNCTFEGQPFLYGTSETFNNCTFNQNSSGAYNVWTYGAAQVAFNECTFNSAGKSVLIYSEQTDLVNNVTVTDCDFIASAPVEGKAAIEMNSELTAGINLTIDAATTANGFGSGNVSGNSLWNNKMGNDDDANNDITVVVDGETVLKPIYEAQIGDKKFRNLEDAFAAVTDNTTLKIFEGEYDNVLSINESNVTVIGDGEVKLNGVPSLKGTNYKVENIDFVYSTGRTNLSGSGLIKDCSFTATAGDGDNFRYCYGTEGAMITFENCVLDAPMWAIHFDSAPGLDLVLTDCKINGRVALGANLGSLAATGTTFENGYVNVWGTEDGATFTESKFVDVPYIFTGYDADNIVKFNDCEVTVGSDTSDVVNIIYGGIDNANALIYVDDVLKTGVAAVDNMHYATFEEALEAIDDNVTLKLLKDIDIEEPITITKNNVTLDGNYKTLTYTGSNRAIDVPNNAEATINTTIKNLKIVAETANRGINYNDNGTLNVDNVTVTIGDEVDGYAINFPGLADGATVNITNNSKLTSRNPLNIWGENMTINVTDSEITSVDVSDRYNYAAIQLNNEIPTVGPNGAIANGTVVTVTGGKITALDETGEPSFAVANATETGVVNISETTVVVGKQVNYVLNIGGAYFATLQEAIDAIEEYGYNSPIVIMKSFATSEAATVKNGLNVTIDLAGKTITVTDNTTKNFEAIKNQGTLTIKDSSADKTGKITVTATTNSGWNRYSAVIANTVGGKLTVDGGTFEHLGGTDMAYGIDNLTNGKGTYAETVINGGTIKSTYRGIRQFLNGTEAQNILTVNGGTIEGANKSIWMQDPNTYANSGALTVTEDAKLFGDVNLTATAGSTEWPVEVSIAAVALQGESTVLTSNLPVGIDVQNINGTYGVVNVVAQIGDVKYQSLAEAATAAQDGETIKLLWAEGHAPIAMNASFFGKNVTITGTATVDWSKGWLFVGRGGAGDATVTFDGANLTSSVTTNENSGLGIHVSGREKDTNNKYDGTLVIKNGSNIQLDYLIDRGTITIDNATLTVKNGFGIAGRPASETESGKNATATISLENGAKLIVNNHNGMGVGQAAYVLEGYGIMNIDATSTFETTQSFNISANGTMNVNGGNVKVAGTLTNAGTVYVTGAANLDANVTGNGWFYMNGVALDADTKLHGAKVGFINGVNTIVGSTIDNGFFSVGIGQNAAATTAAAFAGANGITLGNVTVNVSENAIIGGNGESYSGWVGSAYGADKTQHTYTLNVENSLAAFGYMHVSKDGIMNINGRSADDNKYTQDNSNVNFYAGDLIVNGNVTINNADAWVKFTKMSVDHTDGVLNITGDTNYESSRHNGSTTGTSLVFFKAGKVNIANGTTVEIDNATTLVEGAELNIASRNVIAKGAVTGNGTINLTHLDAKFTAQEGLTVNNGVEGNTDYGVTYVNGAYKFAQYVAQIGDEKYLTLQEAVEAAQNDETITLLVDVEQADGVIIDSKNIVVDLNGKTFTVTEGANTNNRNFKIIGTSVVTIKNGTMVAAGDYSSGAYGTVRTEGAANVTLTGLKLYNYRGNGLNIKALGGTTVAIDDTEIYSQYGGGIEAAGGTITLAETVKVEQKGMYTAPYNSMAISVNGGGLVTVNGGTYSTECITAEEANNQGTSHGPWVVGVLNSGGKLIINGGTFSNDNFGDNSLATYARGAVLADTGAEIEIKGGTFNALKAIIDMTNNLGDANNNPSALLSGGTFSADPRISGMYASHLIVVAQGYNVVNNEDGTYSVVEDQVAKIGDVTYKLLHEAFNAAQDGDEIVVLKDITYTKANGYVNGEYIDGLVYTGGKSFTVDFGGYTITDNGEINDYLVYLKNQGEKDNEITFKNGKIAIKAERTNTAWAAITVGANSATYKTTLNLDNMKVVNGNPYNESNQVIRTRNGATVNLNNNTVVTSNGTSYGVVAETGSTVNINSGAKVVQQESGTTSGNEVYTAVSGNGTINIYDGAIIESDNYAIHNMTSGNTVINIYGGTIKADEVAVHVATNGGNGESAVANISGGTFTGSLETYTDAASIVITGGIFSEKPSEGFIAENYGAFPYDENSWVVRQISGEQTFELTAGWNWVSSYITEFNVNGLAMLQQGLGTNGIQIKNNLKSSTYSNQTGQWNGSLTTTSVNEMYKVKVGLEEDMESLQFNFEGSYVNYDECEIILYPGWNYIGYPVNVETNVADALVLLSADGQEEFNGPSVGDVLKSQQGAAIYFGIDNMPWMFDNQFNLIPGEGYMYHNTSGAVKILRYTTKNSSATTATNNRSSKYWTVDATQYSSNMTMIAMTDVEGDNYEVAAFVNGEVRGSSRPVYVESLDAYILILTISGDDVEEMTFRYYDITTGEEVEFSNRINYSSDAVVGSIAEPYMLTRGTTGIGEAEMSQVNIYPNPTTTGTEINLQATCDKVEVFNALGAKVAEYQNVDSIDALETAGIYVIRITNDSNVQNCKLVVR